MAPRFFSRRTRKEVSKWEGPILKHKFREHGIVSDFVFLHDNVHIVSGSADAMMRKWNCDTGVLVGEPWLLEGKGESIWALALSPDGKMIMCGREDGSVERWNIDGKISGGVWPGHSWVVRELSWSPSGDHIASGSYDGTILIRNAKSGKVEVGPIETEQIGVSALAYSPSGERIASGGLNQTISIWNTKTGELVVGPIKDPENAVTSVVWSSDSSKLCCSSGKFAHVFDSKSGVLLHELGHDSLVNSIALSPKNNVLACVGYNGVVQLWDTESHKPLCRPFHQDRGDLYCVSFSQDGKYLACGGRDATITLWTVQDKVDELAVLTFQQLEQNHVQPQSTQQPEETRPRPQRPQSPSSYLNADATQGDAIIEESHNDPYHNFFQSSQSSLPAMTSGPPQLPSLSLAQRFWNTISRHHLPAHESIPLHERPKRKFFTSRARLHSPLEPAATKPNKATPEGTVCAGDDEEGENDDDRGSANNSLGARKDKGKQREEPLTGTRSSPSDNPNFPADPNSKDNRNPWKRIMQIQGKDPTDTKIAPAMKRPEVVKVYAVRGFKRFVTMKRVRKTKSLVVTGGIPPSPAHASVSSPAGTSSQAMSVQVGPPSHVVVSNGSQCLPTIGGPSSHASPSHASPSHFVTNYHTNHDSDSRSSIDGSCNRFLDKICFPRGHYHEDS